MARGLFASPPPRKSPPPPPRPPTPPNNHPYVILTYVFINISCLPAKFDSSFYLLNSMLSGNSIEKFIFEEPNQYITHFERPVSDIENIYSCLEKNNISLSQLSITENDNREIYDKIFYSSRYYNNTTIEFSINNTYTLSSNIITIYQSGEGISVGICVALAIGGMCLCSCICAAICYNSNRVCPE